MNTRTAGVTNQEKCSGNSGSQFSPYGTSHSGQAFDRDTRLQLIHEPAPLRYLFRFPKQLKVTT